MGIVEELHFGFDVWCDDFDLASLFPKLFRLAANKDAKVFNYMEVINGVLNWNSSLLGPLKIGNWI